MQNYAVFLKDEKGDLVEDTNFIGRIEALTKMIDWSARLKAGWSITIKSFTD